MNIKFGKTITDKVGKFDKFTIATLFNGQEYSIHSSDGYRKNSFGEPEIYYTELQVSPIKPYDMQEYAWAQYNEEDEKVCIIRNGRTLFKRSIKGLQSVYDCTGEDLFEIADNDYSEFKKMYNSWFQDVIKKIIILLEKENKKYDSIIDRT